MNNSFFVRHFLFILRLPFIRIFGYTLTLVSLFSFTPDPKRTPPIFASVPPAPASIAPAPASGISIAATMESDILRLVNQHRRSMGLKSLQMNTLESSLARQHSQNMATGKTPFGHEGFKDRAAYLNKKMGPIHLAAENVASGQMSAREVVDGWLNSPGHRRNIEGNFRLTGIGLARGSKGMIYFTQIFTQ